MAKRNRGMVTTEEYEKAKALFETYVQRVQKEGEVKLAAEVKKLLGTCWRYRDRHSFGYYGWRLYMKVVSVKGTSITTEKYHVSPTLTVITQDKQNVYSLPVIDSGYERITEKQFQNARTKILLRLKAQYLVGGKA